MQLFWNCQDEKIRLVDYDYSPNGAYFLTICVKDRRALLGVIVGRGILDAPIAELSEYEETLEKTIEFVDNEKNEIDIHKYAIMPNHIHMIVVIRDWNGGATGKPRPTIESCRTDRAAAFSIFS